MNKNEILIELSQSPMTKVGKEEFNEQSGPQKIFSAIWELESEVNNGGFSQYFLNESAESVSFVVEAVTANRQDLPGLDEVGAGVHSLESRQGNAAIFASGVS